MYTLLSIIAQSNQRSTVVWGKEPEIWSQKAKGKEWRTTANTIASNHIKHFRYSTWLQVAFHLLISTMNMTVYSMHTHIVTINSLSDN